MTLKKYTQAKKTRYVVTTCYDEWFDFLRKSITVTQPEGVFIKKLSDNTFNDIDNMNPEECEKIHSFDVLMKWKN
jgi:hypothetical protein